MRVHPADGTSGDHASTSEPKPSGVHSNAHSVRDNALESAANLSDVEKRIFFRKANAIRFALAVFSLAFLALFYIFLRKPAFVGLEQLFETIDRMGWYGMVVVASMFIFAAVVPIPWPYYSVLAMAAGFAFGFVNGLGTVLVGVNFFGNMECLLIRKFFLCCLPTMERNRYFLAMSGAIGKNAIKVQSFARLGPQPYWLNNLVFSLTLEMPVSKYVLGHFVGEFVNATVYVFSGTLIKNLGAVFSGEEPPNRLQIAVGLVGVLLLVVLFPILLVYVRRELKLITADQESELHEIPLPSEDDASNAAAPRRGSGASLTSSFSTLSSEGKQKPASPVWLPVIDKNTGTQRQRLPPLHIPPPPVKRQGSLDQLSKGGSSEPHRCPSDPRGGAWEEVPVDEKDVLAARPVVVGGDGRPGLGRRGKSEDHIAHGGGADGLKRATSAPPPVDPTWAPTTDRLVPLPPPPPSFRRLSVEPSVRTRLATAPAAAQLTAPPPGTMGTSPPPATSLPTLPLPPHSIIDELPPLPPLRERSNSSVDAQGL